MSVKMDEDERQPLLKGIFSIMLASSPGQIFRLRNGRTETEARKKGLVSIARVTFDHSPESGESVHTRIFVCDISPYNHVKMALQETYCLRCNL